MVLPVPGAVPVCVTTRALLLRISVRLSVNQTAEYQIYNCYQYGFSTRRLYCGQTNTLPRNRWEIKNAGCAVVLSWERVIKVDKSTEGPMTLTHDDQCRNRTKIQTVN